MQTVAEEILHRHAVLLVEDVIKLDVKIIEVEAVVRRDVGRRRSSWWE